MSRTTTYTNAVTFTPVSSGAGNNYAFTTTTTAASAITQAYSDSNSTTAARLQVPSTYASRIYDAYFYFDSELISEIPNDAIINSVTGKVKYKLSSTNTGRIASVSAQLYSNTTAKGSPITARSTTTTAYTLTAGTWTRSELDNMRLYIAAQRGTNTSNSAYLYLYGADVTVNYSVNGIEYEVSFVNQSSDVTTDPSTTQYVFQGGTQTISFYGIDDISDVTIKDNNTDITSSLVYVAPSNNTASVDSIDGVTYGFSTSGTGYISTNKGQASSVAMCRLNITATSECVLKLYVINYAEATYDYGIIGKLDTSLSTATGTSDSSNWYWAGSASSMNVNTEQLVEFNISSGSHYIDIKYRKDNYTDSNNDALWFRYELEPGTTQEKYLYAISNISSDHVISIDDATGGTYYNINVSSTYTGATVSPSSQSIREGRSATVNIDVDNLYEIKVKDNNVDVTSSVTGSPGNYTYTISNIQTAHTITVEENTNYSVTVTSTYTGATGTASPSKVYVGQNSVIDIDVDNLYEIVVKDNGTDVTGDIVVVQGETTTSTFDVSEYIESASSYDSVYSTYYVTNGVAGSGSTTRACVYVEQTAYAEAKLTYKFDCSSIPENAIITNVVCVAGASCYSSGQYFETRTLQLYNGTNAKGTATTITGNGSTKANHTINGGSWTREELNDICIVARVVRGDNTTQASFSFWGATLAISYTVPAGKSYTISNVQTNHTITIEEAPYYTITTANTYTGATISGPSKVYDGQNATITVSVTNLYEVVITDNNVNITNSFNGSNGTYTYTLTNVSGNHSISVVEAPYATVSVVSYYSSVTGSPASQKVYLGRSAAITFTGTLTGLVIKDGETDITANVSQNTYTISNVQADHTIYIYREANYVKQNGTFAEIKIYYRKVDDSWVTITKSAFESIVTANTMQYGGYFSGITSIGEVSETTKAISINDGQLQSGTYKLVYIDENGDPLTNYDKITDFTIS